MHRTMGRLTAALTTATLVAIASPAWGHVHVDSDDATQGGFGLATFRVPNESDTAATTRVTVALPKDTPFAHLTAESKPGWEVSTTTKKLDEPIKNGDFEISEPVRTITWTATGSGIAPGEHATFGVSGGPFPEVDEIVLPTTQTYDDGEVVAWDQEQTGDAEPERPAPVLGLAEADGHHGEAANDAQEASASTDSSTSGDMALIVAIAAAVLAAAALLVSVRQNRSRA
ncbi:MAG: YcnI family protein [Aeromicrobium sp.]|uniref:YcnI family copper-binding membrane protein n=1 Tax=Aeromicrobium sp. TaxID=1871063 RepID=UPI003C3DEE7A